MHTIFNKLKTTIFFSLLVVCTALFAKVTTYTEHRKITSYNKCTVLYGRTSVFVSYLFPYIQIECLR